MSKIFSVATGFQYSVNIEYDIGDDAKLKNFIPTRAALDLLADILRSVRPTSTDRARILIGAYGRGKSHAVLTILSMLMKRDLALFEKLLPKIHSDAELSRLIENFYSSPEKILPVIINGTSTNLNQAFLSALRRTLAKFDLADIMPTTNFQAAVKVLRRWEKNYPATFDMFKIRLNEPVANFIDKLENFDAAAYETFERLYPEMTAGSTFDPFHGIEAVELYESVAIGLRAKGYSGLYVVYDEFSKFLETNIARATVSDTKMLQDFAEKASRSGALQLHLLLISHKEISNYIDALPKDKLDGWRGVSDRFRHVRMNNDFARMYEIISQVIVRRKTPWKNFCHRHAAEFTALRELYAETGIFRDVPAEDLAAVIEGCFPLHPVSTFILPRLSERVAQNERTLFTFLAAEGVSTLPAFLKNFADKFTMLTPDKIYDYFAPLFRRELHEELRKIFATSSRILTREISPLAAKIVKTIALIYMLEQFELLAPTKARLSEIFSCAHSAEEIARAFDELIEQKLVVYLRRSNNYLKLKQSSGVDIKQKIHDTAVNLAGKISVADALNDANFDNVLYPSRHNAEREMTRWFAFRFIAGADLDAVNSAVDGDGIIFGVLAKNDTELAALTERVIAASSSNARYMFVLPKSFVDVRDAVIEFAAVKKLKTLAEDDAVLFDEYEVVYDDLREVVGNFIDGYTHPEHGCAIYVHGGEILHMAGKAALSEQLSKICDAVYDLTPIINNEVINKNDITSAAANSRNKIVAALLRRELEPKLGLRGTGQEISIMRSTLIRTGVLLDGDNPQINLRPDDVHMRNLLQTIERFILTGGSFAKLYDMLTAPGGRIGLRRGVIPIYLAAVMREHRQQISIINGGEVVPLNVDALNEINDAPENFSLECVAWDSAEKNFVARLTAGFAEFVGAENSDPCDCAANAMRRWYLSLPKYARELRRLPDGSDAPEDCLALRKLLRQNLGGTELLLKRLPKIFGTGLAAAERILAAKKFFDEALDDMRRYLAARMLKIFPPAESLSDALRTWRNSLDEKISEQLFADGTENFLRAINSAAADEKIFVAVLAEAVAGLRLEDWNERTAEKFFDRLTRLKSTAENFRRETASGRQIIFVDALGNRTVKQFDDAELSARGKLLRNQITAALESMGQSISVQEKRLVLAEILRTVC